MITHERLHELDERIFLLKQTRDEQVYTHEHNVLSEIQDKIISEIFNNHAEAQTGTVSLSESEKLNLRGILSSSSDQFNFNDDPAFFNSSLCAIKFTEFDELKKVIDSTYDNELRDISTTPTILKEGDNHKPSMTVRVKTALSIIMSDAINKSIDANGLEVRGFMRELTKMASKLVGPILLTLVERNVYPNIERAKQGSWATVPFQIKKSYCLLLESQVLHKYSLPISRCQSMWLAKHYLCVSFNLKRQDAGTF